MISGKKSRTKNNSNKNNQVGKIIAGIGVIAATGLIVANVGGRVVRWPGYEVREVVDGDTFITKEDQAIRLMSADAPEAGRCGSKEAKEALEKLVMGRPLYIKVVYRDQYNRLIGYVYDGDVFVNEEMLKQGMADYQAMAKNPVPELQKARESAAEKGVGIFSDKCTQRENKEKPKCVIKGNINGGSGKRLYRFPGCGQYNQTTVQLYVGDRWFCSEKEATAAGFEKGSDCFEKEWR